MIVGTELRANPLCLRAVKKSTFRLSHTVSTLQHRTTSGCILRATESERDCSQSNKACFRRAPKIEVPEI